MKNLAALSLRDGWFLKTSLFELSMPKRKKQRAFHPLSARCFCCLFPLIDVNGLKFRSSSRPDRK